VIFLFFGTNVFGGLDWSRGTLTNADNRIRNANATAYASNGNVYVAGTEENAADHKLIVVKKYSSSGVLLNSITSSYTSLPTWTTASDYVTSISLDASGNVYLLGAQYTTIDRHEDIVVIKYNSSLTQQWKKYIYNTAYPTIGYDDKPAKLLFDDQGYVYVAGTWYQPSMTSGNEEIFVRKYNSSGTVIYTTPVPEVLDTTISDASDMCIDLNRNVTVIAGAEDNSSNTFIMYARISSAGVMQWKKFYAPPANFNFSNSPKIECTSAGVLYFSNSLYRYVPPQTYSGKIVTVKLKSTGTKIWDRFTTEVNYYPNDVTLREEHNNIYTGCDFAGSTGIGAYNYRIYKYNSSGTLQWSHTSTETTTQFFTFEVFSTTSLFSTFYDNQSGCPKIKKFDVSNGSVIWTESLTTSTPAGYNYAKIYLGAISINSSTSEVAFCGAIHGTESSSPFDVEYRWHIRKYGATSPRAASEELISDNIISEIKIELFPNPATNELTVSSKQLDVRDEIRIIDTNGKIVKHKLIDNNSSQQTVTVNDLQNGIYFVSVNTKGKMITQKLIVRH
ncbi:MAG TPA: T9SS type A sorting domain-containing protein, partial [Bacteroidia bacterium]|nr:T9SS type A sorting domain-containing protein [Bacteroidia bacterium]